MLLEKVKAQVIIGEKLAIVSPSHVICSEVWHNTFDTNKSNLCLHDVTLYVRSLEGVY